MIDFGFRSCSGKITFKTTHRSKKCLVLLGSPLNRIKNKFSILTRLLLHNDFLTFDELHLMLCRVYSVDIDDDDKVKYKDLEGDWITIADSNDLQLAIQVKNKTLQKINIVTNNFCYHILEISKMVTIIIMYGASDVFRSL